MITSKLEVKERAQLKRCEQYGIELNTETLSDGSVVWDVWLNEAAISCTDEAHARQLQAEIEAAIERHAV